MQNLCLHLYAFFCNEFHYFHQILKGIHGYKMLRVPLLRESENLRTGTVPFALCDVEQDCAGEAAGVSFAD